MQTEEAEPGQAAPLCGSGGRAVPWRWRGAQLSPNTGRQAGPQLAPTPGFHQEGSRGGVGEGARVYRRVVIVLSFKNSLVAGANLHSVGSFLGHVHSSSFEAGLCDLRASWPDQSPLTCKDSRPCCGWRGEETWGHEGGGLRLPELHWPLFWLSPAKLTARQSKRQTPSFTKPVPLWVRIGEEEERWEKAVEV